jgi:chromosome segregation ATPase
MSKSEITLESLDQRFDQMLGVMSEFANSVDARFDAVDARFDTVDARFNSVDAKFISIESRLDRIESEIVDLKASYNRLLNTVDGFLARIDKYETELVARDHEIERLKRWIQEIADKTGVNLTA